MAFMRISVEMKGNIEWCALAEDERWARVGVKENMEWCAAVGGGLGVKENTEWGTTVGSGLGKSSFWAWKSGNRDDLRRRGEDERVVDRENRPF